MITYPAYFTETSDIYIEFNQARENYTIYFTGLFQDISKFYLSIPGFETVKDAENWITKHRPTAQPFDLPFC